MKSVFLPWTGGQQTTGPICKMRHDERKEMFHIYQKRIKCFCPRGHVGLRQIATDPLPMDFSGHIQLEMDYSIFHREPCHFLSAWQRKSTLDPVGKKKPNSLRMFRPLLIIVLLMRFIHPSHPLTFNKPERWDLLREMCQYEREMCGLWQFVF